MLSLPDTKTHITKPADKLKTQITARPSVVGVSLQELEPQVRGLQRSCQEAAEGLPCFAMQCLPQTLHCPVPAASVPTHLHSKHQPSHKLGISLSLSLLEVESCAATAKLPPIPPPAAMVKRKLADAEKRANAGLATTTSLQAPKAQAPRLMTTKHTPKPNFHQPHTKASNTP